MHLRFLPWETFKARVHPIFKSLHFTAPFAAFKIHDGQYSGYFSLHHEISF